MARDYKGTGALFKNNYKKEDKHPDYKGEMEMGGLKYDMAGWIRKSKGGKSYLSVVIGDLKNQQPADRVQSHDDVPPPIDNFDDLPF